MSSDSTAKLLTTHQIPAGASCAVCHCNPCEMRYMQEVIVASPPSVLLMELAPSQMDAVGLADAATLLQQLYDLGYTEISHSG